MNKIIQSSNGIYTEVQIIKNDDEKPFMSSSLQQEKNIYDLIPINNFKMMYQTRSKSSHRKCLILLVLINFGIIIGKKIFIYLLDYFAVLFHLNAFI